MFVRSTKYGDKCEVRVTRYGLETNVECLTLIREFRSRVSHGNLNSACLPAASGTSRFPSYFVLGTLYIVQFAFLQFLKHPSKARGLGNAAMQFRDGYALLLRAIAVTDGDCIVFQGLVIHRNTEGSSNQVLACISLSD